MSHRKWRETKQHPSRDTSGHQISCSLVSLHFLCDILSSHSVRTHTSLDNRKSQVERSVVDEKWASRHPRHSRLELELVAPCFSTKKVASSILCPEKESISRSIQYQTQPRLKFTLLCKFVHKILRILHSCSLWLTAHWATTWREIRTSE